MKPKNVAMVNLHPRTCKDKTGRGHAGGRTLRALRFKDVSRGTQWDTRWNRLKSNLSIAFWSPAVSETSICLPGEPHKDFKKAWIHFVEAKFLLDFVLKNSRFPECNGGVSKHTRG